MSSGSTYFTTLPTAEQGPGDPHLSDPSGGYSPSFSASDLENPVANNDAAIAGLLTRLGISAWFDANKDLFSSDAFGDGLPPPPDDPWLPGGPFNPGFGSGGSSFNEDDPPEEPSPTGDDLPVEPSDPTGDNGAPAAPSIDDPVYLPGGDLAIEVVAERTPVYLPGGDLVIEVVADRTPDLPNAVDDPAPTASISPTSANTSGEVPGLPTGGPGFIPRVPSTIFIPDVAIGGTQHGLSFRPVRDTPAQLAAAVKEAAKWGLKYGNPLNAPAAVNDGINFVMDRAFEGRPDKRDQFVSGVIVVAPVLEGPAAEATIADARAAAARASASVAVRVGDAAASLMESAEGAVGRFMSERGAFGDGKLPTDLDLETPVAWERLPAEAQAAFKQQKMRATATQIAGKGHPEPITSKKLQQLMDDNNGVDSFGNPLDPGEFRMFHSTTYQTQDGSIFDFSWFEHPLILDQGTGLPSVQHPHISPQ